MRQESKWENQEFVKAYYKKYKEKNRIKIKKYQKKYQQKSEVKIKNRIRSKKDYQKNKEIILKKGIEYRKRPEVIARRKEIYNKPENKIRQRECHKIYGREYTKRFEVKKKRNKSQKYRRKNDESYNLKINLRRNVLKAFTHYSKTGKIKSSKKYGINYEAIIKHLGPKPNDGRTYEVDHIIPLSLFDFNNLEHIKKAFAPKNHQWLTKEINRWKSNRLIKPLTNKQKEKLQKQLIKRPIQLK